MKKLFCMTLMILGMMSMAFAADAKGGIRGIVIDASSREALEFVNPSSLAPAGAVQRATGRSPALSES